MSENLTMQAVHCSRCGKRVSQYANVQVSQYVTVQGEPAPLIVRAWVECPECMQAWADDGPRSDEPHPHWATMTDAEKDEAIRKAI